MIREWSTGDEHCWLRCLVRGEAKGSPSLCGTSDNFVARDDTITNERGWVLVCSSTAMYYNMGATPSRLHCGPCFDHEDSIMEFISFDQS